MVDPAADARDAARAREGDADAFAALVRRHAPRVHDVARRMLRDAHEAEDVTQQAFWNAWRAMGRFDLSRPFSHWILRIATNLCRNRYAARRRDPVGRAAGGEEAAPAPTAPPDPRPPDETRARVRLAIEALPEAYRLVVVLRHVHDLPLEAIAEITGDPLGTVKTHLHRGRAALRQSLSGDETRGPGPGTTGRAP